MPKFILHYFDVRGLGEFTRLILHYAGVEFEDRRYKREDWSRIKDNDDLFPYHEMPVLEVDGKPIPKSMAILRYLGNELDMAGQNNIEKAECDAFAYAFEEIYMTFYRKVYLMEDGTEKEKAAKEFLETFAPSNLQKIEKCFVKNCNGEGFLVGSKITFADILFMGMVDIFGIKLLDGVPKLRDLYLRLRNLPTIKNYVDNRVESDH